jgi:hypothetical protein
MGGQWLPTAALDPIRSPRLDSAMGCNGPAKLLAIPDLATGTPPKPSLASGATIAFSVFVHSAGQVSRCSAFDDVFIDQIADHLRHAWKPFFHAT